MGSQDGMLSGFLKNVESMLLPTVEVREEKYYIPHLPKTSVRDLCGAIDKRDPPAVKNGKVESTWKNDSIVAHRMGCL